MHTYHKRNKKIQGFTASEHPNYNIWAGIKSRCNNKNEPAYVNYGGRGITYCKEWEHFENFCNDMGVRPSKKHSIDRIDNDGNYTPENCKWFTRHEQSSNRRKFKTNTSGHTGVKPLSNGRYIAQVDYKKVRYKISNSFETLQDAICARENLIYKLNNQIDVTDMITRKARYDSTTGVKGISSHSDGGYVVRKTINGSRKYLGYFKTFDDAKKALENE